MKRNIIILNIVLISTITNLIFADSTSANESFSACVQELDNKTGVQLNTAIKNCQDIYQNQLANESFSTCVKNLDNKTSIKINTAIKECQKVFVNDYLGESFFTCIKNLDKIRSINTNTAQTICQTTLNNAQGDFIPFIDVDGDDRQKSDFQVCLEAGYSLNQCKKVK